MQRTVVCMKWGTLYGVDYVNVLYNACRANLTGEFRFVCLTDDRAGFLPQVEVFPIPDIGLEKAHWYHGAWPKLAVFSADLYGLEGRALFVDLDMVIWGKLDDFFTYGNGIITLDSAPWRYRNGAPRTMTSIFGFDVSEHCYLLERLSTDRDQLIARYDIEQNFLHGEAHEIGYWPQDWVKSYKYHIRRPLGLDRFIKPKAPENIVKVLCFHGRPRPIDLIRPPKGNWDRFPHYGHGPVDWMVDYWTRYGGSI